MTKIKVGGQLPTAKGLFNVPINARAMGYNIVQIMISDSVNWDPYDYDDSTIMEYKKMMYGIETYVHLPFTINPCKENRNFGRFTLKKFMKVSQAMGASAVVIHPGFRQEQTEKQAAQNLLKFFEGVVEKFDIKIPILIEVDAGSKNGSKVGSLEFVADALQTLGLAEYGMVIDTTHLYARGVNLWDKEVRERVTNKYGKLIKLIHLNVPDPVCTLGSNVDRHNSPFDSFHLSSEGLVKDMAKWPMILERHSLSIQGQDVSYVRSVLQPPSQ